MTYRGTVVNGAIVLSDQSVHLPEGVAVRVEIESVDSANDAQGTDGEAPTMYDKYQSIIGAIKDMPEDFAAEHDHYIHGTPKRRQQ